MARIEKINQSVKEEISRIIQFDIKDPRLEFVTVTDVQVSRDLQHARVFFTVLGAAEKILDAEEGLTSARGFIRRLVGQRVRMRYTPEIDFIPDRSLEYGTGIETAIERLKNDLPESPKGD